MGWMPRTSNPPEMTNDLDLYWLIPGVLAGTSMPWLHPRRHDALGAARGDFADDLPLFWNAGVRAIVCLMNMPGVVKHYESAGFAALLAPIPDGGVPSPELFDTVMDFIEDQRAKGHPVAVHCAAGLGRTGTILAGYLIRHGDDVITALQKVRTVRPGAVETRQQEIFLQGIRPR